MDAPNDRSRTRRTTGAAPPISTPSRVAIFVYVACVLAIVIMVSMTLFDDYRYTFHSDGALKTILARQAWAEGRIVPREWVYANGDLFFIGPQVFSELLYPATGLTYLNNALADWFAYISLVLAAVFAGKAVLGHWRGAWLGAALVASGLCAASFEFTVAQGAYSMWAALSLFLSAAAAVAARSPRKSDRQSWKLLASVATLSLLGAACNPTRGIISIVVPIALGWFVYSLLRGEGSLRDRLRGTLHPIMIAVLGGAILGLLVNRYAIMPHIHNFNAAARLGLSSPAEMWKHVTMLPYAWFDYLRIGVDWTMLTPWRRLVQACLWVLAVAMAASPVAIVLRAKRYDSGVVAFAWATIAMYGVAIAALVVAPSLFLGTGELRYLTFAMMNSLVTVVAVLLPSAVPGSGRRTLATVTALFAVALSAQWSIERSMDGKGLGGSYRDRLALTALLEREHIGAFASTYWYSHVITVLSGGSVEGYPVSIAPRFGPFAHHMPRYLHQGTSGPRQAVVLDASEATPAALARIESALGKPANRYSDAGFVVLAYDTDILSAVIKGLSGFDLPLDAKGLNVGIWPATIAPCAGCDVRVKVANHGAQMLTSGGSLPLVIGAFAEDASGHRLPAEGRGYFQGVVPTGGATDVDVQIPTSLPPGTAKIRICLVQETVAWRCEQTHVEAPPAEPVH
jgi:hypothetical protein